MAASTLGELTAEDVAALDHQLTRLISNHKSAEAAYVQLSRRPMPSYMGVALAAPKLTTAQRSKLEAAYEADSGRLAASDASDAAYDRMINFMHQLVRLPSLSRDVLKLKARACLFETPLDRLREEGFGGVADLMAQLATTDMDGGPMSGSGQ